MALTDAERIRLLELEEEEYQYQKSLKAEPPATPPPSNLPGGEATLGQEAKHVAAGLGEAAFGTIEAPWAIGKLGTRLLSKALGGGGNAMTRGVFENVLERDKHLPMPDAIRPGYEAVRDFATRPRVDAAENPIANALKKGAEFLSPSKLNPASLAVNVAGTAGPAAIDYLSNTQGFLADSPGMKAAMEFITSLGGSTTAGKLATPTTAVRAQEAVSEFDTQPPLALRGEVRDQWLADQRSALADTLRAETGRDTAGTLADLSQSPGLYNLEASLGRGTPGRAGIEQARQARLEQQQEQVGTEFGTGDPGLARREAATVAAEERAGLVQAREAQEQRLRQRESADIAAADTQLAQARQQLLDDRVAAQATETSALAQARQRQQESDLRLAQAADDAEEASSLAEASETGRQPAQTVAERSGATQAAVLARDTELRDKAAALWSEADKNMDVPVFGLQVQLKLMADKLSPSQKADFERDYGVELDQIAQWDGPQSVPEISHLKAKLGASAAGKSESKSSTLSSKTAGEMSRVIGDYLGQVERKYPEAVAASKELMESTRTQLLKKTDQKDPETFVGNLGLSGEQGGATMRHITGTGSQEALTQAGEALRSLAYQQPGGVDADWLARHADALSYHPRIRAELEEVASAKAGAKTAGERLSITERQEAKTSEDITRGEKEASSALSTALAQYDTGVERAAGARAKGVAEAGRKAKAAQRDLESRAKQQQKDVDAKLSTQYGDKPEGTIRSLLTAPDRTEDLARLYGSMAAPAEKASFRAHARNELLAATVDAPSLDKLTKHTRDRLVDAGVMSRSEMDKIEAVLAQAKADTKARKDAKGVDLPPRITDTDALKAAMQAQFVTNVTGQGSQIWMTAKVGKFLANHLRKKRYSPKVAAQVEKYIANPKEYVKDFAKVKNRDVAATLLMNKLYGVGRLAEASEEE